eukprot:TRINITY_DN13918_c0_g1_i2.p1 TRINITY_DN13918_c0_g1~~TRINITY_DN13918_c0_g1_i2.p1  ORF type:complete len:299 (+),score=45.06 TRINITY_DN13918_c0_g1_i2:65-961(+)
MCIRDRYQRRVHGCLVKRKPKELSNADKALIARLESVDKNEQEQRRKQKEEHELENTMCKICLEPLFQSQYFGLDSCGHTFHTQCLLDYIKSQIDERKLPIRCAECKAEMDRANIEDILPGDYKDKFFRFSLENLVSLNSDMFSCCPTPDCTYMFEFAQGDTEFLCDVCNKHYCLACRTDWHKGQSCAEYRVSKEWGKNDDHFINFVKGQKFRQCSRCKFWVERSEGCNYMTCRCGYIFCYKCGKEGGGHGACPCGYYQFPCQHFQTILFLVAQEQTCLLYTSPSPRDGLLSRMPSSA